MSTAYQAFQRHVQEELAPARKRPGMYVGSLGTMGLHNMIYGIVGNCVAEAQKGFCSNIEIVIAADNAVSVSDDGRGISVEADPVTGISSLDLVMTDLTLSKKNSLVGQRYKVANELVSLPTVNALSAWLKVDVRMDGTRYRQDYVGGVPQAPVHVAGAVPGHGTTISFLPDLEVFGGSYHYELLDERFRDLAYLNPGLRFDFRDERPGSPQEHRFSFDGGLVSFVRYLNRHRWGDLLETISFAGSFEGGDVAVALQYATSRHESAEILVSFANNAPMPQGGTHVAGFRSGLTRTLNRYGREAGLLAPNKERLAGDAIRKGLTSVVHVRLDEPRFELSTREKLGNPQVRYQVEAIVQDRIYSFLSQNPALGQAIIHHCRGAQ